MPNCFQLTRKSDVESGPVVLAKIDEEMCLHFNVPCDPKHWCYQWYDIIGLRLAMGESFEEMRKDFSDCVIQWKDKPLVVKEYEELIKISIWLEANFITDSFARIGKF